MTLPANPRSARSSSPQVTFSVDPGIYDGDRSRRMNNPAAVRNSIVQPDLRHHYSGPICARRWISLCDDPAYGHRRLVALIRSALPSILQALKADAGKLTALDHVSLGPGNGAIDLRILRSIQSVLPLGHYYCLDSSFELLCHAIGRVTRTRALGNLKVSAICGDFAKLRRPHLPPVSDGQKRLFTLTGFTLGNFSESELLTRISRLMSKRDYLLLDARLHSLPNWDGKRKLRPQEKSILLDHYQPESVKRFVFGPVETMTMAKPGDVQIEYEVDADKSSVPGAVGIVIFCRSLDTTMRLTGERLKKARLDLACTTLYPYSNLNLWLASRGFEPVWQNKAESVGLFLLRRK